MYAKFRNYRINKALGIFRKRQQQPQHHQQQQQRRRALGPFPGPKTNGLLL